MSAIRDAVVASAPSLFWDFQDAASPAVCSDPVYNGTGSGGLTWQEPGPMVDESDYSLYFDGVTPTQVSVPDGAKVDLGDGPFTIELWMRMVDPLDPDGQFFLSKGSSSYGIRNSPSTHRAWLMRSGSTLVADAQKQVNSTAWHHVVYTKNGSARTAFIDGIETTISVANQTLSNNSSVLTFGRYPPNAPTDEPFQGWLAYVAFYTRILGSEEVYAHYKAAGYPRTKARSIAHERIWTPQESIHHENQTTWRPFADESAFNQPLPEVKPLHPNSAAMIYKMTVTWQAINPAPFFTLGIPGSSSNDYSHPIYFNRPDDPEFTVLPNLDPLLYDPPYYDSDWFGSTFRIPQHALAATGSDAHMCVIDLERNICWDLYKIIPSQRAGLPEGGGNLYVRCLGRTDLYASGRTVGVGGANAGQIGNAAGMIRYDELMNGHIPHALFMVTRSTSGELVYPCGGTAGVYDPVDAPGCGERFFLDMTEAEIEALDTLDINKTIYKAMAQYGSIVADTAGTSGRAWSLMLESAFPWYAEGGKALDPGRLLGAERAGTSEMYFSIPSDVYYWNWPGAIDWPNKLKVLKRGTIKTYSELTGLPEPPIKITPLEADGRGGEVDETP